MASTVKENAIGELQEEINTLVTKTNELIASSSVDPSVAALLQSMTVIIKLLAKQNLNVNNSNNMSSSSCQNPASTNGPAPLAHHPPPPPPIQQLPPLNTHEDHKDNLTMPIEINSEIQAKFRETLEKRRQSVRLTSTSSSQSSSEETGSEDSFGIKKRRPKKKQQQSQSNDLPRDGKTTRSSSSRKPKPKKRSSLSSHGSTDNKKDGCRIS